MGYRLTAAAKHDLRVIALRSAKQFGLGAADRYDLLILHTLDLLGRDPFVIGSIQIQGVRGARVYPLRLSRLQTLARNRVGSPPHVVVYVAGTDANAIILRLLHERMALPQAARRAVRDADL